MDFSRDFDPMVKKSMQKSLMKSTGKKIISCVKSIITLENKIWKTQLEKYFGNNVYIQLSYISFIYI